MTTPENSEDFSPDFDPHEVSVEAPADAADMARPVEPVAVDEDVHRGLEVNEYDAVEQSHAVPFEEDYR